MHEMTLAASLVRLVEEHAAEHRLARVSAVTVTLGALAPVEEHALSFGFDVACRGTIAEGARLRIARAPARAYCVGCAGEVEVAAHGQPCPVCSGQEWIPLSGGEMRLTSLEGT